MTRGVVWVATGAAHVAAARASAASVRASNPGLATAIFCDAEAPGPGFDMVEAVERAHARSKVDCLPRTPFDETLYLDTDTRVRGDLGDLFRLLERFDVAAAHRVRDPARMRGAPPDEGPPLAFPEHNGGVLLYRRAPEVLAFLEDWRARFHAGGASADQIGLRAALWASDVRLTALPPRYNARRWTWADATFSGRAAPVILHMNRYHPTKAGGPVRRALAAISGPHG
jgi:hypothetical protein